MASPKASGSQVRQTAAPRRRVGRCNRLAQPLSHKRDFPLVKLPLGLAVDLAVFPSRGFGGIPRPFRHRLDCIGQPMRDKQRTEDRIFAIINDQQKMQVIRHDHEIAYRRRRSNAMDRPQGELNDFTEPRQLGPRFLAKHPRENLSPLGDNEREKKNCRPKWLNASFTY